MATLLDTVAHDYQKSTFQTWSYWRTQTQAGENWAMVWLNDRIFLQATHDSTSRSEVLGQFDSVRFISLQAVDLQGQSYNHAWNQKSLQLSDGHGLIATFNPDEFPNEPPRVYHLMGMENPDLGMARLTQREIFSMPLGGEIHSTSIEEITSIFVTYPYTSKTTVLTNSKVVDRYIQADTLKIILDGLSVRKKRVVKDFQNIEYKYDFGNFTGYELVIPLGDFPLPYEYEIDLDIYYGSEEGLSSLLSRHHDGWTANGFYPRVSPICSHKRRLLASSSMGDSSTACLFTTIDMGYDYIGYESLGLYQVSAAMDHYSYSIPVYYAFPDDTAGTPIDFDSLLAIATHLESPQISPLRVYPNPARDQLFVREVPAGWIDPQVTLLDLTGRVVRQVPLTEEAVDLRGLPAGTYLLELSAQGQQQLRHRVIKAK
jgi:hypothetical protein